MLLLQEAKDPAYSEARLRNMIEARRKGRILTIVIEPCRACNLKCDYCDAHSGHHSDVVNKGMMTFALYADIVQQIRDCDYRLKQLQFHGNGEPLLNTQLEDMVSRAKELDIADSLRVITNGVLLTSARFDALAESGVDEIHISVDSVARLVYRKEKGMDLAHKVIGNVEAAIEKVKRLNNIKLFVKFTQHDTSVIERWGTAAEKSSVFHLKYQPIVDTGIGMVKRVVSYTTPCEIPFYLMYVMYDGTVSACCTDVFKQLNIGDLKMNTITQVADSARLYEIRLAHLKGDFEAIPLCKYCGNRTAVDLRNCTMEIREILLACRSNTDFAQSNKKSG
jgi:organic radical activating enzyme